MVSNHFRHDDTVDVVDDDDDDATRVLDLLDDTGSLEVHTSLSVTDVRGRAVDDTVDDGFAVVCQELQP